MAEHPGALAGPPIRWGELARVLVVRPDNLGDVLLAGPALRALRRAAPRAQLDLLAAPAGAAAGPLLPEVDQVLTASVSWQQIGPGDVPLGDDLELLAQLRREQYQAVVILTSFSQSPWPAGYLCHLAGVPVRVGASKEFGGAGLTHWVPAPPDAWHQVDRALHLLAQVGVAPAGRRLAARVPTPAAAATAALLRGHGLPVGQRYALLLPGASCSARRYPARRLATVARRLAAAGLRVVVAGTDRETPLVAEVAGAAPDGIGLAGRLDAPGLAAAAAGAAVVISNNSGGAHLASAVGTPVVVLFAGTDLPAQYAPRFTPAAVLTVPTECAPCQRFTCPYAQECLDLAPEAVAGQALHLAGVAPGPPALVTPGPPARRRTGPATPPPDGG